MNKLDTTEGFTFIEMVVVMMVAITMGLIAASNLNQWMENSRFRGSVTSLYADIQTAKMEAIKKNIEVGVSFVYAAACNQEGGSYTLFINNNAGIPPVYDAGDTLIKTVTFGPPDTKGVGICNTAAQEEWTPGDATTKMNPITTITYDVRGLPMTDTTAAPPTTTAGYIKVTSEHGRENFVFVNAIGNQKIQ